MKEIDLSIPSGAIFSEDRIYRYALWRVWNFKKPLRLQIGLNPSKAGEIATDNTITVSIKRAYNDGFGGFLQGNLYAFISTNPKELLKNGEYIGEYNDVYLKLMISLVDQVLCGWGSFKPVKKRANDVLRMIPQPFCLGINKDGQPTHPLYISYDVSVMEYKL